MENKKKESTFKEIHGKTRVGKFLQDNGPGLLKTVLGVAGGLIPGASGVTEAIGGLIKSSDELDAQQKEHALELLNLDMENVKSAREMQIAALNQDDLFSKRFIYYLAIFWSVIGGVYIFLVTFMEVVNVRAADTVLGFLLGTIVATIINFFFGSSKGSKDKTSILSKS